MKAKEWSEKVGLKLNIQKTNMASSPIPSWQIDGERVETVSDFIFLAPKSLQMVIAAIKFQKGKIAQRNINSLRYANDTTLMAESEEELPAS